MFDTEDEALHALQELRKQQIVDNNTHAFIAKGVTESPLHSQLKTLFATHDTD
jgi:hypothetical protein